MELIWEQQGEHDEAEYGYSIAAIDFNGDNIDDLVVGSKKWSAEGTPSGPNHGKIYFYYGGDDFDNIPELTIDGSQYSYSTGLGRKVINLGDINGDGYEDLGSRRSGDWQTVRYYLEIYYGGPDCDTIPDFQHIIYNDDISGLYSFYPLGDVNGDNYDDAGFVIVTQETDVNQYYIIYGGEIPQVEYWNTIGYGGMSIREIGNINNDEFDDFIVGFKDTEFQLKHNVIFYGNTIIDTTITDTLFSQTGTTFDPGGAYAGDFNGNGTDDFIGCWGFASSGTYLWFGGHENNNEPDLYLSCVSGGDKSFGYGDLNNDGYSDIVLGEPGWSNNQGKAYFFIGGPYPNGSVDLDIEAPVIVGTEFGTSVAVGDFNNDSFDDAAIGAPEDASYLDEGFVYVYAGNDSLVDINQGVDDEGIEINNKGLLNAYPNPFNAEINFEINTQYLRDFQVEIYNVKGQLIETINVKDRYFAWKAKEKASGVYFCKLLYKNKILEVKKITLMK